MLDYASVLRAGQSLVPDLRQQMIQDEFLDQRRQQFQMQQDALQRQLAEAEQAKRQEAEFIAARDRALASGNPQAIMDLRLRYPEFTKSMKDAFDALDADVRKADLTQIGTMYARGQAGDFEGAAEVMRRRVEADRAAGVSDPTDEAILEALESGDPREQRVAMGQIGILLAAVDSDKFGETYGKLNPTEATPAAIREYDARVAKFGKAAADAWLRNQDTKLVPVQAGGTVFAQGGDTVPATQEGGDPSGSGGRARILPRSARPPGMTDQQLFDAALERVEQGADVDTVFRQLREWGVSVR